MVRAKGSTATTLASWPDQAGQMGLSKSKKTLEMHCVMAGVDLEAVRPSGLTKGTLYMRGTVLGVK